MVQGGTPMPSCSPPGIHPDAVREQNLFREHCFMLKNIQQLMVPSGSSVSEATPVCLGLGGSLVRGAALRDISSQPCEGAVGCPHPKSSRCGKLT